MSTKTLDIEGKSIDVAIEKACRDFGVAREKLNIEIISEGSSGFLGVMSKKAKIRASLVSLDMNMDFDLSNNFATDAKPKSEARIKIESKPEPKAEPKAERKPEPKAKPNAAPKQAPKASLRKAEPRTEPKPSREINAEPQMARKIESKPLAELKPVVIIPSSALALKAQELLAGFLQRMSFDCQVTVMETEEKIILNIEGDGSGLLIGKRGQNLDALQYILNKAINQAEADRKMIMVDSETYRSRREESLLGLAERIREKVKKTKKPVSLSHMNAHDRRIIHLALQEDEALVTKSRGEGEYRKIVILPARRGNGNQSRDRKQRAEG
jgi:spoIIIJ-associated protein